MFRETRKYFYIEHIESSSEKSLKGYKAAVKSTVKSKIIVFHPRRVLICTYAHNNSWRRTPNGLWISTSSYALTSKFPSCQPFCIGNSVRSKTWRWGYITQNYFYLYIWQFGLSLVAEHRGDAREWKQYWKCNRY